MVRIFKRGESRITLCTVKYFFTSESFHTKDAHVFFMVLLNCELLNGHVPIWMTLCKQKSDINIFLSCPCSTPLSLPQCLAPLVHGCVVAVGSADHFLFYRFPRNRCRDDPCSNTWKCPKKSELGMTEGWNGDSKYLRFALARLQFRP